jgi:hypothetical protein
MEVSSQSHVSAVLPQIKEAPKFSGMNFGGASDRRGNFGGSNTVCAHFRE